MAETPLHAKILSAPADRQEECLLFEVLPPEIRTQIFSFALADYPDPSPDKHYAAATCYTRPHYFAPQKSDTALLRSCRAVYAECWFLPFVLREQTHWLTQQDRAPPEYDTQLFPSHGGAAGRWALQSQLEQIHKQQGDGKEVEIKELRVFAQMYKLEGGKFAELLETPGLRPRRLTLTIRHADWWFWEHDEPLRFEAGWIEAVSKVLPSSVREFCIELESLERKKDQVDKIVQQMRQKWFFKRSDGAALYADATGGNAKVNRWSGNSTWHSKRWVRDETEPGIINYYVASIPFLPQRVVERRGGKVGDQGQWAAENNIFDASKMKLHLPGQTRIEDAVPYVWDGQLDGQLDGDMMLD